MTLLHYIDDASLDELIQTQYELFKCCTTTSVTVVPPPCLVQWVKSKIKFKWRQDKTHSNSKCKIMYDDMDKRVTSEQGQLEGDVLKTLLKSKRESR